MSVHTNNVQRLTTAVGIQLDQKLLSTFT